MRFKIFILISIFFSLFLFCPVQAKYGLEETQKATGGDLPTSVGGASSLPALAGKIVNVALSLIGILFFCLMLYAGITWMKAMGSSEDVTKAKDMITQAIIGLVIVMMAYAISNFVFSSLGATGGGSGGGGGSSGEKTFKEKDECQIQDETWADGVVLAGTKGLWNTKEPVGCQPACRFYNKDAKCKKDACPGKENKNSAATCPVGNCCLP